MPYILLGTSSQLQIKVPTNASTNWGNVMKSDTFQKIAEHDHSGSGKGAQLGTGSLLDNAVTGAKLRLSNDEYLKARNFALDADVNILKVNTSDKIEFETEISVLDLSNDTFLRARNAGDDGYVNILKVNPQDGVELFISEVSSPATAILDDDTSVETDTGILTLSSGQFADVTGSITRDGESRTFKISLDEIEGTIIEESDIDELGIEFIFSGGTLKYKSTNTGFNATIKYFIIRG